MVADGPRLRRVICRRLRPDRQQRVLHAWELAIDKTGGYLYSRALLALLSAVFHTAAFSVIGLRYPVALGIWVGLVSQFLPVIGTYLAGVLPVLVALLDDPIRALWVLIVIVIYQQIENYLFAPRITARTLELHPAVAFSAAIAGAAMLGPVGALARPARLRDGPGLPRASGCPSHDVVESHLTTAKPPPGRGGSERLGPGPGPSARGRRVGEAGGDGAAGDDAGPPTPPSRRTRTEPAAMTDIPFVPPLEVRYGAVEQVSPPHPAGRRREPVASSRTAAPAPTSSGTGRVAVIDPGPVLDSHRDALAARWRASEVTHIFVTHCHADHSPLAAWLHEQTGAPTLAFGPHGAVDPDDDVVSEEAIDTRVRAGRPPGPRRRSWPATAGRSSAVHTPGHTSNHLLLRAGRRSGRCSRATT